MLALHHDVDTTLHGLRAGPRSFHAHWRESEVLPGMYIHLDLPHSIFLKSRSFLYARVASLCRSIERKPLHANHDDGTNFTQSRRVEALFPCHETETAT